MGRLMDEVRTTKRWTKSRILRRDFRIGDSTTDSVGVLACAATTRMMESSKTRNSFMMDEVAR